MDARTRLAGTLTLAILLNVTWAGQAHEANGDIVATKDATFPMFAHVQPDTAGAEPAGLRDVVAAAILAVVWSELGANANGSLALDKFDLDRIDEHDWLISGEGAVVLPSAGDERIGLRFNTRFDGRLQAIDRPEIEFGGVAPGERMVPNDPAVIRQLEDELSTRIAEDFGERNPRLQFDSISSVEAGKHLLRVTAQGLADFGIAGTSKTSIEGLYDLRENRWRKLDYQLAAGSEWQPGQADGRHIAGL